MGVPSGFTKIGDIKPDVVVIGTGFGATMTALTIAEKLKDKNKA